MAFRLSSIASTLSVLFRSVDTQYIFQEFHFSFESSFTIKCVYYFTMLLGQRSLDQTNMTKVVGLGGENYCRIEDNFEATEEPVQLTS